MGTDTAKKNKGLILIVDDALGNRELLADILTNAGYSAHQESSGDQALRYAESALPDLVLLDVMMPDMDGHETCRQLKVNHRTRDIPVIFISALDSVEDQIRGFAAGGVDYIARPFRAKEVLARVETHLALQGLRKDLEARVRARTVELEEANARLKEEIAERSRAEEKLAEERNLLRTLIDSVPDYIFAKDRQGRFTLTNVAHAAAAGRTPDDLLEKVAADVFPIEVAAQFHHDDESVMQSGQPLVNQDRATCDSNGNTRYVLTTKIPLRNPQEEVIGLVGMSRDITERHLMQETLQESEQSYKYLFNHTMQQAQYTESLLRNLPVGVMLMTPEWRIEETNQALRNMTGWLQDELRHQRIDFIIPEDPIKNDLDFFQMVVDGESDDYHETILLCKDGSHLKVRIRAARLADANGTFVGILSTVEDITQIEIVQEARRVAETLRIELEKEKELGELKSRFVSMASHEFRTPLATIQATIDSLHNYYDRMSLEQRAQRFQKIRYQITRVTDLLENVLTIQKIEAEAPEFAPTPIDLSLFLEEYVEHVRKVNPGLPIEYSCDDPEHCMIIVDKTLLQQIVSNLVSNAISYSLDGDPVQVDVFRDSDGNVVIRVSDIGIGIPEAEQKYLFSDFFRGSNTTGIPGSGLGLAITKHAVERHGGTIKFESKVDVGTTFTVTLPTQQPTHSDRARHYGMENA